MTARGTLSDLLRLMNAEADACVRRKLGAALALVALGGIIAALAPLALKSMVDTVATARDPLQHWTTSTAALGATYLLALCAGRLLAELRPPTFGMAEQRLYARLNRRFFQHLLGLRLEFHLSRRTGALVDTLSQAITGCQLLLVHFVDTIVPVAVELVTVGIVLFHLGQPALVASFVATASAYLLIYSSSIGTLTRKAHAVSLASRNKQAALTDSLLNCETIKLFNEETRVGMVYAAATADLEAQWGRLHWQRLKVGLALAATFTLSVTASLTIAGDALGRGVLTIGGFVLANVYMLQIVRPLEMLGIALRDVSHAVALAGPLLDVLKEPTEESLQPAMPRASRSEPATRPAAPAICMARGAGAANVCFRDVSFGYSRARPVLNNLNLDIPAGSSVAIVGASGAGKSSLVRLLLRLYEPHRGRILMDQMPLNDYPATVLRSMIGLVPQDTVLFNDTIAHNIAIGKAGATHDEIVRAARLAHLTDFIASLPAGYDTVVGERGLKTSGGERQRIAIARAVIKQPRLYVFDEATSSLDSRTEAAILRNLHEISSGCTTITIAHRLSTILHADEIVVLDNGQIAERGAHAALLQRGGAYAKLWRMQRPGPAGIDRERSARHAPQAATDSLDSPHTGASCRRPA